MIKKQLEIGGRRCYLYECGTPEALLVQPVDDHDIAVLDSEVEHIERLSGGRGFVLAAFKVNDWNADLSPWEAPPVFGDEAFGSGAQETLEYVTVELLPALMRGGALEAEPELGACGDDEGPAPKLTGDSCAGVPVYLGGYSLAGFFALWAAYQTERFAGVAACSPSVWFPGWIDYAEARAIKAPLVYLSLGDKEEKVRNPVMRTVGDCIRRQAEILGGDPGCRECTLEMNQGNHFKEPDLRTAKGFAWLLQKMNG